MESRCKTLTHQFNERYPTAHSNLRISLQISENKLFVKKAEGSRVWDLDGNEYIDYMGAMGPNILGHRHPELIQALKDFMEEQSFSIGSGVLFSEDDISVAEKLNKHVPCAERVKFNVTGSEAVQMAIRLARAYTGRPYFIRFGGHYHGWMDNVLGGNLDPTPEDRPFATESPDADPFSDPYFTRGKAMDALQQSFLLPWNEPEILEETLKRHGDEVALIHFEPLVCNHFCQLPKPGFLEKVRSLCDEYGVVLSFDEVITGFRMGLDGAQGHFGITPDLATFGKAMAAGVPISAVLGKADILDQMKDGRVLSPGTFNGWPFAMRAILTTLSILERNDCEAYTTIENVQEQLESGLRDLAAKNGIPLRIQGARGVFVTMFGLEPDVTVYTDEDLQSLDIDMFIKFWAGMQAAGILMIPGGRWYPSIVHTQADVERTLAAAKQVFDNF
jgi:glutamate-1-semialdehyde 2,1-aminomutase